MSDAKDTPVKRQYNRRETHTEDLPIRQYGDVDLGLDAQLVRGESIPFEGDPEAAKAYYAELAFMEEPLTIRIEENSGNAEYPETHVPVSVQGKMAEVFYNGKWVEIGWLPIGQTLITKRKYVEVLARSVSVTLRTIHDDATVERPRNTERRNNKVNYPMSILQDDNPRGRQWLQNIRMGH
jgi:hypothetical protein